MNNREKAEEMARVLKGKLWSVWDKQASKYLHAGRNSETREEAVEDAFDWWLEGSGLSRKDYEKMKNLEVEEKEEILDSVGLEICQLHRKLEGHG